MPHLLPIQSFLGICHARCHSCGVKNLPIQKIYEKHKAPKKVLKKRATEKNARKKRSKTKCLKTWKTKETAKNRWKSQNWRKKDRPKTKSTLLCSIGLNCTTLYITVPYRPVLYSVNISVQYCTVLVGTVWYCTVLQGVVRL